MNLSIIALFAVFSLSATAAEPEKYHVAKPVEVTVTAKRVTPAKSTESAVKNEKAATKPADSKSTK